MNEGKPGLSGDVGSPGFSISLSCMELDRDGTGDVTRRYRFCAAHRLHTDLYHPQKTGRFREVQ